MSTSVLAAERLASLAKPPGSLGTLEDWAATLCTVQGTLTPAASPQTVLVFCADHGVKKADAALSPFPASVSQAVFRSLCAGISGTAVLARAAGAHLTVVDVGLDAELVDVGPGCGAGGAPPGVSVRHAKVARGTADLCAGAAMSEEHLAAALEVGREAVAVEVAERAAKVVAVGEVGIGNTTAAAALLALLTGAEPADCCGRGTGLDDAGLEHKQQAAPIPPLYLPYTSSKSRLCLPCISPTSPLYPEHKQQAVRRACALHRGPVAAASAASAQVRVRVRVRVRVGERVRVRVRARVRVMVS